MRNHRKYIALTALSVLMVALFLVTCVREVWRMPAAMARQEREWVALGAKLYAENCMQCHGPRGEGVVGMPLNRPELQGNPQDTKFKDTFAMIVQTLNYGRPGTNTPLWVKQPDGTWLSYTKMPAWSRAAGGAMDENMIQGLAYFVAMGNLPLDPDDPDSGTFWDAIGDESRFPPQPTEMKPAMPKAAGLTDAENQQVAELIETMPAKKAVPSCLNCHAFGSKGAKIGPDLTYVGAWGLDAEFLKRWINNPLKVPNDQRMPVWWSQHRLETGPKPDLKNPVIAPDERKSFMPPYEGKLTPAEMDLLVRYLMGLGVKK